MKSRERNIQRLGMLCLIVILSSGRVCCRGPVPEHFGTGEPDHRLLGAVTDRLAFPAVWLEDVSSNGRHFALKREKKFSFDPSNASSTWIWFLKGQWTPRGMNEIETNDPWNWRWFIPRWMDIRLGWNGTGHFDGGWLLDSNFYQFDRCELDHIPPFSTDLQKHQFQSNHSFI